jgi:cytochrome c biogenesis protein
MKKILLLLASLHLTLIAMLALVGTALGSYKNPDIPVIWVALPLMLLGLNLLAAIMTNRQFRRQHGLLLFHLGLLAIIIFAAVGLMTSMDGHIEITEGQMFDPENVIVDRKGPWHTLHLERVNFIQGNVEVDFAPMLKRRHTRSRAWIPGDDGKQQPVMLGDNKTLTAAGYRFLTTSNKGYAVILSWIDNTGDVSSGAINMPSFPTLDWKQQHNWTTPQGEELALVLQQSNVIQLDDHWTLDSKNTNDIRLLIKTEEQSVELSQGNTLRLQGGVLRYEGLRLWIGYRIDYNPMLFWQFIAALIAILGLGFHFWRKFSQYPSTTVLAGQKEIGHSVHA